MKCAFGSALVVAAIAGMASAQIMIPDSTSDDVMLFDAFDGSLLNASFIDLSPVGASTPINAIQVGSEIWVSDQVADSIFRFSLDGSTHLGTITGGMDNIRGIEYAGNTVYVSNSGANNGAPGESVVTIDVPSLSVSGFFLVGDDQSGDPFDVLNYHGDLLINDIDGQDLERHATNGSWLSTFHNSDGVSGIDFPEQMALTSSDTVLAAGFSSPSGLYEYDAAGNQINYWALGSGLRGVIELGNGNILFTDGSGVYVFDPVNGTISASMTGVSARFADTLIPAPGALSILGLAGLAAVRRRR
jgi:hypothetical protein